MISAGNFINKFLKVHYDSNGDIYKITVKGEGSLTENTVIILLNKLKGWNIGSTL